MDGKSELLHLDFIGDRGASLLGLKTLSFLQVRSRTRRQATLQSITTPFRRNGSHFPVRVVQAFHAQ